MSNCFTIDKPLFWELLRVRCERITSTNGHLIDSMPLQPTKKTPIKIIYSGSSVIRYRQGGSQRIAIRYTTNETGAKNILISFSGISKYYSIPIKPDTVSHKKNSIYCDLTMDSSIQSGIFEMNIAVQDSQNNVSKSIDKFVVIGSKVQNTSSLLPSPWLMIRSTNVANKHGHYIQFDSLDRCGEWVDEKQQKTYEDKYETALSGIATEQNLNFNYLVKADTILEFGSKESTYYIIALTPKTLILKEVQGGDGRFGVFKRVKNEWKNTNNATNTSASSKKNRYSNQISEPLSQDTITNEEEPSKGDTAN